MGLGGIATRAGEGEGERLKGRPQPRVRVGEGEGKGEGDLTLGVRVRVSHSCLGGECEACPTVGRGGGVGLRRVVGLAKADPDPTWIG